MYKRQDDVPPDTWPPVVNCPFINLALIKKIKRSGSDSYSYSVQGNMDDILESKEKIEYDEVFGVFGSGELVLVEGCPGGGKTTLVNKVVRDWARGGDVLNNARLVYLITLRDLVPEREGNLSDILDLFYLNRKKCEKVLDGIEKCEGEGVCFVIDGLDEYQPRNESKSVIYCLLRKQCLHMAMVIVASRPVATATLRGLATRRIEVLGFTQQQIFEYIDKFPFSSDISDTFRSQLRKYLHSHLNILHMCYLPVHSAMICFLYQEKEGDIPPTQTKIYEEFTKCIVLRQKKNVKMIKLILVHWKIYKRIRETSRICVNLPMI